MLNRQAPLNKTYLRAHDGPYMTKELKKASMTRWRLESNFNRTRTNNYWTAHKRQRNLSVKILHQNRSIYYAQLDPKVVNEDRKFWKAVKPLFSSEVQCSSSITLLANGITELTVSKVAEVFSKYFMNIAKSLDISNIHAQEHFNDHIDDTNLAIVERFRTHPSILKIKSSIDNTIDFLFRKMTTEDMLLQLQSLYHKKGSP